MAKKNIMMLIALFCLFGSGIILAPLSSPQPIAVSDESDLSSIEDNTSKPKASTVTYSNVTIVSDNWDDGKEWNDGSSDCPDIAVDKWGNFHAVWVDSTDGPWESAGETEIMYANYTKATGQWSNATVISDKWEDGNDWSNDDSDSPAIAVDESGNIYVVYIEDTDFAAKWGTDAEIMCVNYSVATGQWSNITVVSDNWDDGNTWNKGSSFSPDIAIDGNGMVHVVWEDYSPGPWNSVGETEIMYANYTIATGQWTNVTVLSDGWKGSYWNDGQSKVPKIAVDLSNNNVWVVWKDSVDTKWGTDTEIFGANFTEAIGWSNATVISDIWGGNSGDCEAPAIAVDNANNVHVAWVDYTNGPWGIDEVVHAIYSATTGLWSNWTVISDKWDDGTPWHQSGCEYTEIAIDKWNHIHVVWYDSPNTVYEWGGDDEIMYAKSTDYGVSWTNATVISDKWADGKEWNDGNSDRPSIAASSSVVYVVWEDQTDGPWGNDKEIMGCTIPVYTRPSALPGGADDDDDDDEEADLLVPIVVAAVVISAVGGIALVYIFMKKRTR